MITSDEFGAGLVPRGHQLGQPGEPGPQRDVLGGLAGGAATRNTEVKLDQDVFIASVIFSSICLYLVIMNECLLTVLTDAWVKNKL